MGTAKREKRPSKDPEELPSRESMRGRLPLYAASVRIERRQATRKDSRTKKECKRK